MQNVLYYGQIGFRRRVLKMNNFTKSLNFNKKTEESTFSYYTKKIYLSCFIVLNIYKILNQIIQLNLQIPFF
jgi:hypothetical protein